MEPGIYIVLAIIVLLIIIVISNIKIVPQAYVFVVERLGAFHAAWGTGLHVKVPCSKESIYQRTGSRLQATVSYHKG